MVQFQQEVPENLDMSSLKDSVLLVLLDEMNLAHVELYFSELYQSWKHAVVRKTQFT